MTGAIVVRSGEGWEIVNDDGLIYKRRKKEEDPEPEPTAAQPPGSINDTHWRRTRKKAALRQLKARYLAEIDEWEKILGKLAKPSENAVPQKEVADTDTVQDSPVDVPGTQFDSLVEKLSCQVEQLEMFMEELKALCCDVEYVCKRPDEYGEFYNQIKSPRFLFDALQSVGEDLQEDPDIQQVNTP